MGVNWNRKLEGVKVLSGEIDGDIIRYLVGLGFKIYCVCAVL
jgi:hypothetical protein